MLKRCVISRHPRTSILGFMSGLLSLIVPLSSHADFYLHSWENQREAPRSLRLTPEFNYYSSTANYDAFGSQFTPTGLQSYSRIMTDVTVAYGFNPYLSAYARGSWGRSQADHLTSGGEVFGFTDQTIGFTVHAWESKANPAAKGTSIDVQVQADLPAYSNTAAATAGTPFLGDGSIDLTGGAFLTIPIAQTRNHSWVLGGGGGYTWRSSGFSAAIPWSASLRFVPREEGLILGASLSGIQSLRTDPNATNPAAVTSTTAAGGSFFINAINPSLLTARANLGYQMGRNLSLALNGAYTLWGQATPAGFTAGLGMTARWGTESTKAPNQVSPQDYGKSNQGFVNYAFEARVTKTNDRLNLAKIDKGTQDGVEVGQVFDIFLIKQDGTIGEAIARAKCTSAKSSEAVLTVTEYFEEVWIEEGFVAKRPLQ